jgi:hypothetical protein
MGKYLQICWKVILLLAIVFVLILNVTTVSSLNNKLSYLSEQIRMYGSLYQNIHTEIRNSIERDTLLSQQIVNLLNIENDTIKTLDGLTDNNKGIQEIIEIQGKYNQELKKYIDLQPSKLQQQKRKIENNLIKSTYTISNYTEGFQGSGVLIKYKENFYILSAGHMISEAGEEINTPDNIYLFEKEVLITKLTIKKLDRNNDLVLFSIDNIDKLKIDNYVVIADKEIEKTENIYIVGNPVGIEDLLSEGKIIKYTDNFVYFYDHVYFGSSGGGIFNQKGELVGIISHMMPTFTANIPFVVHGATRQSKIIKFLEEIK